MNTASSSAREHWRQIVQQQKSSGLSVARFCRERGIGQSSLFAWKRRLTREAEASAAPEFVLLKPAGDGDGRHVRCGFDRLAQLAGSVTGQDPRSGARGKLRAQTLARLVST